MQLAGTKQHRPRVFRGSDIHQKVISLPSQAVSLFVRTRPIAPLTQGPTGPAMPFPPSTGRRLFPSEQQEDQFSMLDSGEDNSQTTENCKTGHATPAETRLESPEPPQKGVGGDETFPTASVELTPVPLDNPKALPPNAASGSSHDERPHKRRKTLDRAERPAVAQVRHQLETAGTFSTETYLERKAFILKFCAEKGLTAPVLEAIWKARKHGYHKP